MCIVCDFLFVFVFFFFFFFFFQAEDGIRDGRVTGVQTCALPILDLQWYPRENPTLGASPARIGSRRCRAETHRDRKSTRLNSSHPSISYAVFCLKKKKKKKKNINKQKKKTKHDTEQGRAEASAR